MSQMTIPATRPEWLETEDHFIPSETATAGQWRSHQKRMPRDRDVDQFVRIANRLGWPTMCRYCRAYALLRMKMSPAYRGKDSRIITIRVSMLNAITCNVIQV